MSNYRGVIIEESLEDKSVLHKVKIISTEVEEVTQSHKTPWLTQWTLHTIEIPEEQAEEIAQELSRSLETKHTSWYADYVNDKYHYIIFADKIFKVDRNSQEEYDKAKDYGISIGIPEYQVDFHLAVQEWER